MLMEYDYCFNLIEKTFNMKLEIKFYVLNNYIDDNILAILIIIIYTILIICKY